MIWTSHSILWAALAFCTVLAVPGCQKNRPSETSAAQGKPEAPPPAQADSRPGEEGNLADDQGTGGEVPVPLREPEDQYWNEYEGDEDVGAPDEDVGVPDEEYDNDDYENDESDDGYSEEV